MEKSHAGITQLHLVANNKHSVVWQGIDRSGRTVMVKTPHTNELHGWAAERLMNEVEILRHLAEVEGVPTVYDFFWLQTAGGNRPMLVTEKMPGITLHQKRKRAARYRFSIHECTALLAHTAAVLAHVHSRGIVHTDIKLGNILVSANDRVSIIDWGTARMVDAPHTEAHVIGTVQCMSYEHITNQPLDGRADIYSLGVVMAMLAYGEHVTPRYTVAADGTATQRTSDEIADRIAEGETIKYHLLPRPANVMEQTFQDMLTRMTQWDRTKRLSTMRELLRQL